MRCSRKNSQRTSQRRSNPKCFNRHIAARLRYEGGPISDNEAVYRLLYKNELFVGGVVVDLVVRAVDGDVEGQVEVVVALVVLRLDPGVVCP